MTREPLLGPLALVSIVVVLCLLSMPIAASDQAAPAVTLALRQHLGGVVSDAEPGLGHLYVVQGTELAVYSLDGSTRLGGHWVGEPLRSLAIEGTRAYGTLYGGLRIFDLSDPTRPADAGFIPMPEAYYQGDLSFPKDVVVRDGYAFVGIGENGAWIVRLSDQQTVAQMGSHFHRVALAGQYLMGTDDDWTGLYCGTARAGTKMAAPAVHTGVSFWDISDPANPIDRGKIDVSTAKDAALVGGYLYIGTAADGIEIREFNASDPAASVLVNRWTAGCGISDVEVNEDATRVMLSGVATHYLDTTAPDSPRQLGEAEVAGDLAIQAGRLYVASDQHGLNIYSLGASLDFLRSPLPKGASLGGTLDNSRLFLAQDEAGITALDISQPLSPSVADSEEVGRVRDITSSGNVLYAGSNSTILALNPSGLQVEGTATVPNFATARNLVVGLYHLYVAAEDEGICIYSLADPFSPAFVKCLGEGHIVDLTLSGDLLYATDPNAGVRAYRISDPANPVEAGSYALGSQQVAVNGNLLLVADRADSRVVLLERGSTGSLSPVGEIDTTGVVNGFALSDGLLWMSTNRGLEVFRSDGPAAFSRLAVSDVAAGQRVLAVDHVSYLLAGANGVLVFEAVGVGEPGPTASPVPSPTVSATSPTPPTPEPSATPPSAADTPEPPGQGLRVLLPLLMRGGAAPAQLEITSLSGTTDPEFVTITNTSGTPQEMAGWRLFSTEGLQTYPFPDGYVLGPGASVQVQSYTGAVHDPPAVLLWTTAPMWNNDGDKAELYSHTNQLVDSACYGSGCP